MDGDIATLRAEIADRQEKLRALIADDRSQGTSDPDRVKISFGVEKIKQHKAQRSPTIPYILNLPLRIHLSSPFVYGMILPIALLDICLVIYQATCFRLWKVSPARRGDYVIIDRHQLAYLNSVEKLNCIYCGYANGVFAFAREVAARTERFWCPIKHAMRIRQPHSQYEDFIEFGDAEAWKDHPSRKTPGK